MYSNNKKTKVQLTEDKTITVRHLDPIQSNKVTIKCLSAITPSLAALADGVLSNDRTLTMSTAGQLFIQNMDSDDIESLMLKVLGGIEDIEGETIGEDPKAINTWFAYNPEMEMIDLFAGVFEESIVKKLVGSRLFKRVMPSINKVKEVLNKGTSEDDKETV